jgi:hypothetical protein
MVRPILLASFAVIFPVSIEAQGRVTMPAGSHPVAAAPRAVAHVAQPVVPQAMPAARVAVRSSAPRPRATGASTAHITGRRLGTRRDAATRGPEAVGAGRHRQETPVFIPFLDGGFFLPSSPLVVEEAVAPQEENPETEVAETPQRAHATQPAPAPRQVEEASAAPRQTEEFVFVRRDGTVFFAIAYAWENGTLRYVTSEGLRRSVARETLDLNATQQFNEQRGLNFRLPA